MQSGEIKNNLVHQRAEVTAEVAELLGLRPPIKEEALHLEYPAAEMAGELPEGEAAEAEFIMLTLKEPRLRQEYYKQKINELCLSRRDIGNKAAEIRCKQGADGCNKSKFFRHFDEFFAQKKIYDQATDQLIKQILDISEEEIPALTPAEKSRMPILEGRIELPFKLFVENYQLIKKYSHGIYNSEELSNIYVYKPIGFRRAIGATLGKLLTLSNLYGTCEYCGGKTLTYAAKNYCAARWVIKSYACSICLDCRREYSDYSYDREIIKSFTRYDDMHPRVATRWTMTALVRTLKRLEDVFDHPKGGANEQKL